MFKEHFLSTLPALSHLILPSVSGALSSPSRKENAERF